MRSSRAAVVLCLSFVTPAFAGDPVFREVTMVSTQPLGAKETVTLHGDGTASVERTTAFGKTTTAAGTASSKLLAVVSDAFAKARDAEVSGFLRVGTDVELTLTDRTGRLVVKHNTDVVLLRNDDLRPIVESLKTLGDELANGKPEGLDLPAARLPAFTTITLDRAHPLGSKDSLALFSDGTATLKETSAFGKEKSYSGKASTSELKAIRGTLDGARAAESVTIERLGTQVDLKIDGALKHGNDAWFYKKDGLRPLYVDLLALEKRLRSGEKAPEEPASAPTHNPHPGANPDDLSTAEILRERAAAQAAQASRTHGLNGALSRLNGERTDDEGRVVEGTVPTASRPQVPELHKTVSGKPLPAPPKQEPVAQTPAPQAPVVKKPGPPATPSVAPRKHVVADGETLWGIAQANGMSWQELWNAKRPDGRTNRDFLEGVRPNRLSDKDGVTYVLIYRGEELYFPAPASVERPRLGPPGPIDSTAGP